MATYRIKDWDKHFENHESRKVKGVRWVALPNKHDGKSYRRLTKLPDAPGVFAAWTLIVQVASKVPVRGILADEDGPLTSEDLSDMTGFPVKIFDQAFKALSDKKIGWLEVEKDEDESPVISRDLPQSPATPGSAGSVGNGTEGNRTEDKSIVAPATPDATSEEVISKSRTAHAVEIFEYWKQQHGRNGRTVFDSKRKRAVTEALKHYDVDFIKQAIRGIKLDPFCSGENEQHKVHDDLELICRDASHLERYAALDVGNIRGPTQPTVEPVCTYCNGKGSMPVYDFTLDKDVETDCRFCSSRRAKAS